MEDLRLARVHKNGSSLAVVLPRDLCRALKIERGDQLVITAVRGRCITFSKLREKEKLAVIKY